ncbi:MAG TPA: acetate--CoA ligase family protein [Anaerolineales bacterium]|nr:acetate--CoA ligase family protein [Anaerolineales bacterium]
MDSSLPPFFKPRGVVIIGASTSPEKLGYGVARNLVQSGYPGAIHFVGQRQGELFGLPIYTDLGQLPDPVDLAVLIVPPGATPASIEACGHRGVRAAIIAAAGFREAGEEGAALENQCLEAARKYSVRLLGPNCIGTIDTHLPLDTTFLQPPMPAPGHIGFISHSGAFCAAIIDWARGEGFGFSQIISLGNQVDVNETDALSALADDEHTHVIVMYMETVSDGRRFVEIAREVTQHKPVIALKVGRFEAGQKAAASHTGALAASDTAFEAAFEKAGVLRADTAEQMFDWARVLTSCPLPYSAFRLLGERRHSAQGGIAILTNAGGPGVIAADAVESNGLCLARLDEETVEALRAHLPPAASVHNPVDMLASASPEAYAACLKILLGDENVDGAMVILPPPPMFKAEEVAKKIVEVIAAEDGGLSGPLKPVVIALMGSTLVEKARLVFECAHLPVYPFPERAASALGALWRRQELLATQPQRYGEYKKTPRRRVSVAKPDELFAAYGIQTAPIKLARSVDEAISMANDLGYPVVIKIASPDISHKSDLRGVQLNIEDAAALQSAYMQMMEHVKAAQPTARIDGVYIQQQIADGQDVIAGMVRDPNFGPLMMFGSGGVEVEGLRDVSFALAPLNQAEAEKMIRRTWAGRRLRGFRHIPPADEDSVIDVLIRLSRLAVENGSIEEIEINPLRALGQGAVALDIRIKSVV